MLYFVNFAPSSNSEVTMCSKVPLALRYYVYVYGYVRIGLYNVYAFVPFNCELMVA